MFRSLEETRAIHGSDRNLCLHLIGDGCFGRFHIIGLISLFTKCAWRPKRCSCVSGGYSCHSARPWRRIAADSLRSAPLGRGSLPSPPFFLITLLTRGAWRPERCSCFSAGYSCHLDHLLLMFPTCLLIFVGFFSGCVFDEFSLYLAFKGFSSTLAK